MKPPVNGKLSGCSLTPSQGQETEGKACLSDKLSLSSADNQTTHHGGSISSTILSIHIKSLKYKSLADFDKHYFVSDRLLADFLKHLNIKNGIRLSDSEKINYNDRIKNYIKSEIATYLFDVESIYYVTYPYDLDIKAAIEKFKKEN